MKRAYLRVSFRSDTLKLVGLMNSIIESYVRQGFKLSVRQIYYQLVARDLIENTEASYKRVASIINDARLGGYMDWDAIEDRNRDIEMATRWSSGSSIVQAAAKSFHMDMWDNQPNRVIVVVEKAALAGVLERVCRRYDVPLLAARGYPSVSIIREMVLEHVQPAVSSGQSVTVLHLGDHDPSGIDMSRDLEERLNLFTEQDSERLEVRRIALTMDQIEEKAPPPNPAKTTDARFRSYRSKFGDESWELDALEPGYLVNLLETEFDLLIDSDNWVDRHKYIEGIRKKIQTVANNFKE